MRENVNASFTPYEWLPIKKKMEQLGKNRYEFFRYCVLKESGVILDGTNQTKNQKSNLGRKNNGIGQENIGASEPINDLDTESE